MSPFLVLAALLPAALLLLRVYRLDRIEKEPASVLWALLGCGAAAALLAYLLETLLTALLDCWLVRGSMAYLAAGPAQPCQPQQCPDRERVCRSTGRAAGRACLLFWGILPQAYHWRRPASH